MHSAVALALLVAVAPTPSASPVTQDLSDRDRASLTGCWMSRGHETWTFRAHGAHGLEVVLDSSDSPRRRNPSSVMYAPKADDFAFATAGRIHGLMMIFTLDRDHARIDAYVFSKHDNRGYFYTGNSIVLTRCRKGHVTSR